MKLDLVMWVKNGADVLSKTLARTAQVIPEEVVHRKILINDHSNDDTPHIGKEFNWEIHDNPGSGISNAANYALSMVDCPRFMSLEHDLLLAKEWFNLVPPLLEEDEKVAVASGIRFDVTPDSWHELQKYVYKEYFKPVVAPYLRKRKLGLYTLGKTLDNTLYKTKVIRAVGGFPFMRTNCGQDHILTFILLKHGYRWVVEPRCISEHMRYSFKKILHHHTWYGGCMTEVTQRMKEEDLVPPTDFGIVPPSLAEETKRLIQSIGAGVFMATRTRKPKIVLVHPLIKLYHFVGHFQSYINNGFAS